ncbi:MAG: hypothetical protein IKP68_08595 [Clostridia bacterium]|nr:hypothetical protein [Clostridia bacterium]
MQASTRSLIHNDRGGSFAVNEQNTVNEKGVNEKDGSTPDRSPVICRLFVQTVFVKRINWIVFLIMFGVNSYSAVSLWSFLQISYAPRLLIGLSLCCSILTLINVRTKMLRAVTYIMTSVVLIVGLFYAMYCRRALGFWVAISACVVIATYFLSRPKSRKNTLVTKMIAVIALVVVLGLTIFSGIFVVTSRNSGLVNGPETMWDNESQAVFDEICSDATTDKESIFAAYNWILNNLTYDDDYKPTYQCFNVKRTLSLKSGICYDFANLFAAICRSQGVPCYCLNGYRRDNVNYQHAWNRVFFDGVWWNMDVTFDTCRRNKSPKLSLYGFHACENLYFPDENYVITKIY